MPPPLAGGGVSSCSGDVDVSLVAVFEDCSLAGACPSSFSSAGALEAAVVVDLLSSEGSDLFPSDFCDSVFWGAGVSSAAVVFSSAPPPSNFSKFFFISARSRFCEGPGG